MPFTAIPQTVPEDAPPVRDSLGGYAFLPEGTPWPVCEESRKAMVLFFQFDVRPEFGLSVASGSHLIVFMSPDVNEIDTFDSVPGGEALPEQFWERRLKHFKVFLFSPDEALVPSAQPDPYLVHQRLQFEQDDDPDDPFLFVGGEPRWYQDPELHPGFDFLCQLSEDYPFPKQERAPEQPDGFSRRDYGLFLGNSTSFFARSTPSHPEEVWLVLQN